MFHLHKPSNDLALFELRLKSPHKNLLFIKGNEHECEQIPFTGSVKISTLQDMHVKLINLKLIGEYKIDFFQRDSLGMATDHIGENYCCLEVEWSNLLTDDEGHLNFGDYGDTLVRMRHGKSHSGNNSTTSLNKMAKETSEMSSAQVPSRPSFLRTSSLPHFHRTSSSVSISTSHTASSGSLMRIPNAGIDGTPFKDQGATSASTFLLPKGNYNLPFRVFLPTNISESIEGLNCGRLLYKLECSIERGRFEKTLHKLKHIRILRTLHPQNLNLIETVDIGNTWPKKVQYLVSLNKKGVAVGANIPINILIVPIAKGLKLKSVYGELIQHHHVLYRFGEQQSPEFEVIMGKQDMSFPDPELLPLDKWSFKSHFKVPMSLSKVTQSCDLKNNIIQVKHRLRISIQLLNKEGHTSELRANLPIHLYVSANIGHAVGKHFGVDSHGSFVLEIGLEDYLFKKDDPHYFTGSSSDLLGMAIGNAHGQYHHNHHHHHQSHSNNHSNMHSVVGSPVLSEENESESDNDIDREDQAPPLYQQHVFDKVYDLNNPDTPIEQFRSQSNSRQGSSMNLQGYFGQSGTPPPVHQGSILPRSFGEAFEENAKMHQETDFEGDVSEISKNSSLLDVTNLCRVPSYEFAAEEDVDDQDELTPTYSNSGSNSDVGADLNLAGRPGIGSRAKTWDVSKRENRHSKLFFRKDK